jgi:hypothetical protein
MESDLRRRSDSLPQPIAKRCSPARIAGRKLMKGLLESRRSSRLPNPAGFLGVHGLASGALKRLAELLEVLDGIIHAHSSHRLRVG